MSGPIEVETQDDSIDASVDAAFEQTASAPEPEDKPVEQEAPSEPETPAEQSGPARDASGKFAKRTPDVEPKPEATGQQETPTPEQVPQKVESAAPRVLPPAVKEAWGALPKVVQEYVAKREGDAARRETETAGMRRAHDEFQEAVAPYRHLFTEPPATAVKNVMQTVAVLHTGTAWQKAELAARMITAYGIDVEQLAKYLDNPDTSAPQQPQQQYRDPRVDAWLAQQQQREVASLGAEINRFRTSGKAEYLDSPGVAERMVQLMPPDTGQPVAERLEQAYNAAVWSLPEYRDVLAKRAQRGTATAATQSAKRAAASSVRTSPAPVAPAGKKGDLGDDLDAAWRQVRQSTR